LRARADAERTADKLRALGFAPMVSPAIEIVATGASMPGGAFDAVLATSAKGLEHAGDAGAVRALPLHVVGARTAQIAKQLGWRPDLVTGDAEALLTLLRARYAAPARFLYLTGRERRDDLEAGLRAAGHAVTTVETYEARAARSLSSEALDALTNGEIDAALHYSKRSAEIFLRLARAAGLAEKLRGVTHLALSPDVAEPLEHAACARVLVAQRPDEDHLLRLLRERQP
jgi:uroporphyrinogen-III synthase